MKPILLFIVYFSCFGYAVTAHDVGQLIFPRTLRSGEVLVATSDYPLDLLNITKLWLLDPLRGASKQLFLDIERGGGRVHDIEIARGGNSLLTLEIEGRTDTGFVPLGQSELVRTDLETAEREVIFAGVNLVNFSLSPSAEQALIRFYPEEMSFVNRYDLLLRERWCVVSLKASQNECRELTFAQDTYPRSFVWVSDDTLAYTLNRADDIYMLDTDSFSSERHSLIEGKFALAMHELPGNKLLILCSPVDDSIASGLLNLVLLDLSDGSLTEIGDVPISTSAGVFEVSPQGDYVVVAGGSPATAVLVESQTGNIIQTYPTIYDMQWTSFQWLPTDHTHFLIGNLGFGGGNVMTVVLEPLTNSAVNIVDDLDGTLLVVP